MHQPRPYGLFGRITSEEDSAQVDALVRSLTNFKRIGSLDSLKFVRTLPGGGVAIATDMGGVLRVIVQNPVTEERQDPTFDGLADLKVPMLFSGVIKNAVLRPGQGLRMELTEQARRRLGKYGDEKAKPVAKMQELQRFAIEYSPRHQEFKPDVATSFLYTQYVALRPTWFTGSMATVVQVAGGYGKQDLKALPEHHVERAVMVLPEKVRAKVAKELGNKRLPGYTGKPPESGEIQFDYKFHETHGVAFGADKAPWLVRVSPAGLYVMPLPMVPATTTAAFRAYVEEVGDTELEWLLDKFGGLPSGEGFPTGAGAFEAWRRAGVITKVAATTEFYNCMAYASACGWAFNSQGTEGFNTCWEFGDDGLQRGHAYKLKLSLGDLPDGGKLPEEFHLDDSEDQRLLNAYLSALYKQMTGNKPEHLAIKYKLRRVGIATVMERARSAVKNDSPVAGELDYWNNHQASPMGAPSGGITRVGSGIVWAPGQPRSHPQIKFPEPFMKGCISHDFGRLEGHPAPNPPPLCDTIMYGYYAEDELKVVKYFRDHRNYMAEVEDNYDECMIVGSWQRTVTEGSTTLMGNFYTTDFDERKAAAPITTVTNTVGSDKGYDSKPHFSFDYFFSMVGTIWRNRYFTHKVDSTRSEGYGLTIAVCAPYLERSAMLHAKRENTSGAEKGESLSLYSITDPNSYRMWTYDFVWAWVGGSYEGNMATANNVSPAPKDGNPVWVRGYNYNPGPCTDFADQGDWMGGLPQDYTWLVHPVRHEWSHSGGGGAPSVKEYSTTTPQKSKTEGELMLSILAQPSPINKDPDSRYFTMSPSEFGDVFYVDAIKNAAGEAVYANCSEADPEAPKQRKRFGFTRLADHQSAHHFIGVINE